MPIPVEILDFESNVIIFSPDDGSFANPIELLDTNNVLFQTDGTAGAGRLALDRGKSALSRQLACTLPDN